ncbi:hypothetical protein T440DRAFT_437420 [Plenodomus tracheiphilus IPT5]|uniref:Uncharacterized protein n=1 Tax=Plenodomus tracheiphilus IPT5 TaxID=1408161 RepID=A0A6A7BMB4_9PLEO|nr:hypothetical protein T440DRAFT_437420 [Plenodomus tracheiphilus IPT5]
MNDSLSRRQDFAPRCPAGGTWWSCGYGTKFLGCCARDPCDITCAQGNLYPGAFDPSAYGTFPDATCGTGSKFYTCSAGETFWGCCKTNACSQGGCPDGDLEPAIMNRDDQLIAYHATGGSTTLSTATKTFISATSSASSTGGTPQTKDSTPVAAIAGGTAGGVLALAIITGLLIYYCCFLKKSRKAHVERIAVEDQTNKELQWQLQQQRDAPPDYTTPTHTQPPYNHPTYYAYTHLQSTQPQPPSPQELPIAQLSPLPHKSSPAHTPGPSELSGETTRSELGTPETSPKGRQGEFKQIPASFVLSPLTEFDEPVSGGMGGGGVRRASKGTGRQSRFVEMSPMSSMDGFEDGGLDKRGMQSASPMGVGSAWVAPQDWEFDASTKVVGGNGRLTESQTGLGVDGVDDIMARMERLERLDDQRAARGGRRLPLRDLGHAA